MATNVSSECHRGPKDFSHLTSHLASLGWAYARKLGAVTSAGNDKNINFIVTAVLYWTEWRTKRHKCPFGLKCFLCLPGLSWKSNAYLTGISEQQCETNRTIGLFFVGKNQCLWMRSINCKCTWYKLFHQSMESWVDPNCILSVSQHSSVVMSL